MVLTVVGCSRDADEVIDAADSEDGGLPEETSDTEGSADGAGEPDGEAPSDTDVEPGPCPDGTPRRAWTAGTPGVLRHDLAGELELVESTGRLFSLRRAFDGCSSVVFLPDTLTRSDLDPSRIVYEDVAALVAASPPNVHYVFVPVANSDVLAQSAARRMNSAIEAALEALPRDENDAWFERLHPISVRASAAGWLSAVMREGGSGSQGFAVDREQRIRGVGSLADVTRFSAELQAADRWPWENSLSYAANEVRRFNYEAKLRARLDAEEATVVPLYAGEVLSQFAEKEVTLPTAEQLATFDTLEVDVTVRCPSADGIEFNNCGPWDYLAHLYVYDGEGNLLELARFITSYHREGRAVVDITPMLVRLAEGGVRQMRWEFAPEWNVQPTATWLSLRFSNARKGVRPARLTPLFEGGAFGPEYNASRQPFTGRIGDDTVKTELWALITGHGAELERCAEFCDHRHIFSVNDGFYEKGFAEVGDQAGCMAQIERGAVPNQWGTWWFGRGGWCPGMQVEPYVADVTSRAPAGGAVRVDYAGYLGAEVPESSAGNILMRSYLVEYVPMP
jgi:hypothetical protein